VGLGSPRQTVLVTGAAGFIGSHLSERLVQEGYEVIGLDNLMTGSQANLASIANDPRFHFEVGDVRDPIRPYADVIFNLACPASPVHYQHDPYGTLTTSVQGALRLVEVARQRPVRILQASTSEVYGDPAEHPQKETYWGHVNPIGTRACYDEGKRVAETILMDARRAHRVDARIVRIFNTYGPRMALDDGRVVSNFLSQALRGEALTLYGEGKQTRSFCYVRDLVDGFMAMARAKEIDGPVNLGNPRESTMLELAAVVKNAVGSNVDIVYRPLPADDPKRRCPDITRAKKLLGFEPKVSLEEGVAATAADFKKRLSESAPPRLA
jgi:UDP-glucuronate decarboxylase